MGFVAEMFGRHEKKVVFISLIFFLFVCLFLVISHGQYSKQSFSDEKSYNDYATSMASGTEWLTDTSNYGSFREPFYPMVLSIFYRVFGMESFREVYIFQSIIAVLMLLIIYRLSTIITGNPVTSYLAMLWAGFYVYYLRRVGTLLRETLVYFLMALLFYLLARFFHKKMRGISHLILPAVVYTILFHTDGRYLFFAPFLFIVFAINTRPLIAAIKQYVFFGIIVILCTIPWTIRNYYVYGDVVIVSKYTLNLTGDEVSERNELFNTAIIDSAYSTLHFRSYNENYPRQAERDSVKMGFNPRNRSDLEIKAILAGKTASKTFLGRKWYFFKKMWAPIHPKGRSYAPFPMAYFEMGFSLKHNLISLLQYGILIPFALLAIVISFVKRVRLASILILPIFVQMLLHVITFGIERYRHPVDAFIIILAFWGIGIIWNFIHGKSSKHPTGIL